MEQEVDLVLRFLHHRFGGLSPEAEARLRSLSIDQLEALGVALLDFTQANDLVTWLDQNP